MPEKKNSKQKGTKTSSFGSSKRESHDASRFYNSNLFSGITLPREVDYVDNSSEIPESILDNIITGDSRNMEKIPDNSVHLMVTSPPYNVVKEYDDNLTLSEYLNLLKAVFKETWRIVVPGGRVAINITNVGRKPYVPLHAFVINIMLDLGFHMRGEIIWNKSASAGVSTAWGSFASASNPCLRDIHEYILIFSKLTNKLERSKKVSTISKEDFIEWSKSIWTFSAVSARKIGHPAPFPEELPHRLIQFFTYEGDVVLDPFIGSGTTALAAMKLNRHYIGYEISPEYANLARKRIEEISTT